MKFLITGGAGFIGSHLTDFLLSCGHQVTVFDNLSWGKKEFIFHNLNNPRFKFVQLDLLAYKKILENLDSSTDTVFHLSANSDIMRGMDDPDIDFDNTLVATFNLLKAMKEKKVKKIFFTSGSGVYGNIGTKFAKENYGPLLPVSLYGATKLSAEALIASFVNLYDFQAWIVRPANIVGTRATHGVILDFIRQLQKHSTRLRILGDGKQYKSYLFIDDVLEAFYLIWQKGREKINLYNLSSESFIEVDTIAKIVISEMGLKKVKIIKTGGKGGWKGDVPIIKLDNTQIKRLGWKPKFNSDQAVRKTIKLLLIDAETSSA
ncbi:GDP-mannose 4,6-dehydratase [Candidatus Gottesmanbacteria bacterium]|nr:GDP-mannose 4,6-dehydratase [Candidatus Gottesmanbacteria bacterium]